ncbi:MAG: 3D-(3,5/4)-trihydroxycyclohexane-1,2-dione acylhydrolase (decyclizing) [Thermodesulfobacteriota bacterium]
MHTIRLTMAQALLKFLDNQFVEMDGTENKFVRGVMGIFGHGNVTGLGEALEFMETGLTYICGHNEQGLVHAATAFAKQKNRLAIFACTSSIGPGALNMVNGAATATVNRIPVLLLPGDIFACRQPDPVLQQIEVPGDYTVTANDCFKPVSRYWDRIDRPEKLMTALINAFRVLTDPRDTGAVTLSLPQDVQAEAFDYPAVFFNKRIWHIDRLEPSRRVLLAAAAAIQASRRPLIIAGGGVHYSLAAETLAAFARRFKIPVAETQAGKSAISWKDDMSVGGIGVTGTAAANMLAREADLILAVGTRLTDFTTASKSAFQNPEAHILHLNIHPFDGYKMDGLFMSADARQGLEALQAALAAAGYATEKNYQKKIAVLRRKWDEEVDRLYHPDSKNGNSQTAVVGALNEFLGPEDIVVCAAGSLPGDLHRLWRAERPKTYHMEYGFSCMGYEVAGGLGVKIASPAAEVYVIVGDGSYLMLHSEILTSIREGHKITVVLLNNGGYQCIKNLQESCGSNGFGNEFRRRDKESDRLSGPVADVDFAGYAGSLGVKSFFADTIADLKSKLAAAQNEAGSTLIEIKVAPQTMSSGYESWWRVGVAEVSRSAKVMEANRRMTEKTAKARPY